MINLRYHIVSLAAVLFALAAGIAIGAGFLATASDSLNKTSDSASTTALKNFDAAFADSTSTSLLAGKLQGQSVIIFTLPGASEAEIKSIAGNIQTAGGTVTGQVALQPKILDPANREFVDGIATQAGGDAVNSNLPYERVGQGLARAYLSTGGGTLDEVSSTTRAALTEGGLIKETAAPTNSATMALVVAGPLSEQSADEATVLSNTLPAMDSASNGVAVVGSLSSGGAKGVIGQIRSNSATSKISTFDVTDLGTGQATVVLVLASEAAGQSGSWGGNGATDGEMP